MATIQVYDPQGKSHALPLDLDIQQKDVSQKNFACAIRVLLQNWRQGTVGCKSRGEVSFSNKKPWKQKGTGRARVSSLRSPLWRKGGIIFGPQARVRSLSINEKQNRLVLNNIFFAALEKEAIYCLDFEGDTQKPNTKKAAHLLKSAGLDKRKVVLFLPFEDMVNFASFRNLPSVNVLSFDQPNAFDLSNGDCWVFFKKDLELFKEMVLQWN